MQTECTRLIEFQFKLLHRRMTNNLLFKIGRKDNHNCTIYRKSSDIISPFLTREYTKRNERVIGMDGNFTHSLAHSLDPSLRCKQLNYCFLLRRYHIWQAKLDETSPNFVHFLRLVKSRSIIETKAGDIKKGSPLADSL